MNSFDDFIQQRVKGHKTPVPANAWDNINNKGRKRRRFFFWFIIVALLLGLSIAGYYQYLNKPVKILAVNNAGINKVNKPINKNEQPAEANDEDHLQAATSTINTTTDEKTANNAQKEVISDNNVTVKTPDSNIIAGNAPAKNKPGKDQVINSVNTHAVTSKNRSKINIQPASAESDSNSKNENSVVASQKKSIKKSNEKAQLNIEQGQTETIVQSGNRNNKPEVAVVKQSPLIQQDEPANDDKKEMASNKTTIPVSDEPVKKETITDSINKKNIVTTVDKKQKKSPKKQSKKHAWFLDIAATPVLPIQQYDKPVFTRTQFLNDTKSEFTGQLAKTSLDPSVAFSISLRRSFSKKFFAGIGIQYLLLKDDVKINGTETNTRYSVVDRLVNSVNGPELVSDTVETVSGGIRNISATNSYQFISIPVFAQYNIMQNRSWSFGITGGMVVNVFSKYQNEINKNSSADLLNVSQPIATKNKTSFSLYGGLRFGKYFGRRVDVFTLPSFTAAIGEQTVKNSLINKKIQRLGFSVGISYKIK